MDCNQTSDNNTGKRLKGQTEKLGRRIPVIGLAGGIGSGKSLVAQELGEMGCVVIDADRLAKQVRDLPQTLQAIRASLGQSMFTPDGRIDDKALAELVFASDSCAGEPSPLARLNTIIHPLVAGKCKELIEQYQRSGDFKAVVLDAPLLFEAGLEDCCDAVIFVQADSAARSRRVHSQRGWTESQWAAREKSQIPLDKKQQMSDYIVDNDASISDLRSHLRRLFPRITGTAKGIQHSVGTCKAQGGHLDVGSLNPKNDGASSQKTTELRQGRTRS